MALTTIAASTAAATLSPIILSTSNGVGFVCPEPGVYTFRCEKPWAYSASDSQAYASMTEVAAGDTLTVTVTTASVTRYCKINEIGELARLRVTFEPTDIMAPSGQTIAACAGLTMADAANIAADTTTGSKIGTAVTQKIGFWNAAPIVQPSGAAQAAISATLTDSTGLSGTHDDTLAATTTQADLTGGEDPTEAEFNTLLAEIRVMCQNQSDVAQKVIELVTLVNAMRTALVNAGLIKGAA